MNKRTLRLVYDMLGASVLGVLLAYIGTLVGTVGLPFGMLPLIWLGLRYGGPTAILSSAVVGLVHGALIGYTALPVSWLVVIVLPYLMAGLAGLFAKYTQKTLNNRRFSSTYLNIGTAYLVSLVAFVLVRSLAQWLLNEPLSLDWVQGLTAVAVAWLLGFVVVSQIAIRVPTFLIPKRSKYLSRKETSKLLND